MADLTALARFGALVLDAHREEIADLDAEWLESTAVECGLLASVEMTERCGEGCLCAEYGDFPQGCLRKTLAAKALDTEETT